VDTLFTALRVFVSLAVVVGLLWFVQRRSVRWTRKKTPAKISVIGKQSLGSKASVVIVEADGTRFILGVTDRGVTVLKSRDALTFTDEMAAADAAAGADDAEEVPPLRLAPEPVTAAGFMESITSRQTWKKAAQTLRAPK
jgi:flagellar protein FliO/FliZ